jgi:DNA topoisomerase-3
MKVYIAEKPSLAGDLADILGPRTRRDGYIEGNGFCVTWVYGHLCSLKDPEDYNPNWKEFPKNWA